MRFDGNAARLALRLQMGAARPVDARIDEEPRQAAVLGVLPVPIGGDLRSTRRIECARNVRPGGDAPVRKLGRQLCAGGARADRGGCTSGQDHRGQERAGATQQ
jgi:hypothetical protein